MRRLLAATLLLLSLTGCEFQGLLAPAAEVVIRSGTSFGMCLGYCTTELRLDEQEVRFTRSSRSSEDPTLTQSRAMSPERWNALLAAIDWSAVAALEDVYGCPDCADGGAEWIEVRSATLEKRVTFEYGAEPPEIASLLEQIRELRGHFRSPE